MRHTFQIRQIYFWIYYLNYKALDISSSELYIDYHLLGIGLIANINYKNKNINKSNIRIKTCAGISLGRFYSKVDSRYYIKIQIQILWDFLLKNKEVENRRCLCIMPRMFNANNLEILIYFGQNFWVATDIHKQCL